MAAHQAVQADGRLVIAVDGKTVRGAKNKAGKAPHLFAARVRTASARSPGWQAPPS